MRAYTQASRTNHVVYDVSGGEKKAI